MVKTIHVLSDIAINQIAAGEVVEGPSSVVKELVENAIDAGADKISIEIKDGGHFLIEVSDNGKGMGEEDVLACIERFATSKISSLEDLNSLQSMGFRGEALAAISSVSKFSVLSSTGKVATFLEIAGGGEMKISKASRGRGTTVRVESLFYNTPARKKFQKGRGPSTTEVVKCITKLSLCHKEVAFYLTVDGNEVFTVEGGGGNRLAEVLGKGFFSPEIFINVERDGVKIEGVIAGPEKTRNNRLGQYLVVNKRSVYSMLISNAVTAGFGTSLSRGDFPLFFLSMTFDPAKIDVNVHPQKKEIRFGEEEKVFAMVREVISSSLTGSFTVTTQKEFVSTFRSPFSFKEFNYVEKSDERPCFFTQSTFEEKGYLTVKLLWDELCIIEVTPPHPKFLELEEKGCVLIDLSLLEKIRTKSETPFTGQRLLQPEEIFLTQAEMGICQHHQAAFEGLGIGFNMKDVSIDLLQMPDIAKKEVKDVFMYALALIQQGEQVSDIKEKIHFRVLRKKRYTQEEAIFLVENSFCEKLGSHVTKNDLRRLCLEYKS
jgi:DNA mismatch repair protein MutL